MSEKSTPVVPHSDFDAKSQIAAAPAQPASQARPRVGFVSLGCPKNLVDSEVMMGLLATSGAEITSRAEDADIIVVNTCSFIDSAKQESVDTILEMARFKESGRAKKLIVAGCLVERYRDEIRKNIPQVDAVVGTGELDSILAAAQIEAQGGTLPNSPFKILNSSSASQSLKSGINPQPGARAEGEARERSGRFSRTAWDGATAELPTYLYDEETPRLLATPKHSAYIKIAEGCDHPCAFCIIPQLRGKFRSRRFESVVAEAERLAAQRRAGGDADRPGYDLLRRGFGTEGRIGAICSNSSAANRRTAVGAVSLCLSQQDHRPAGLDTIAEARRFALTWTCHYNTPRRRCCVA